MIVVCGETLIDLVPAGDGLWRALPGGSPANTAVALARLATSTAMLARISRDGFGAALRERLTDNAVDLRYVVAADEPSTLAVVSFDAGGVASYGFYLNGTADWQWQRAELPTRFDDDVVAIHAGSMALMQPPGGAVIEERLRAERGRRVISIDPNVRAIVCPDPVRYREAVERWLSFAHIVKASADDVSWLYPDRAVADVVNEWAANGPALVVITLGGDGALALASSGAAVTVPGVAVDVVDTIGAGDTFSAGLLHALDRQDCLSVTALSRLGAAELEAAARFAVRVSAVACTRAGADPPYAAEVSFEG